MEGLKQMCNKKDRNHVSVWKSKSRNTAIFGVDAPSQFYCIRNEVNKVTFIGNTLGESQIKRCRRCFRHCQTYKFDKGIAWKAALRRISNVLSGHFEYSTIKTTRNYLNPMWVRKWRKMVRNKWFHKETYTEWDKFTTSQAVRLAKESHHSRKRSRCQREKTATAAAEADGTFLLDSAA